MTVYKKSNEFCLTELDTKRNQQLIDTLIKNQFYIYNCDNNCFVSDDCHKRNSNYILNNFVRKLIDTLSVKQLITLELVLTNTPRDVFEDYQRFLQVETRFHKKEQINIQKDFLEYLQEKSGKFKIQTPHDTLLCILKDTCPDDEDYISSEHNSSNQTKILSAIMKYCTQEVKDRVFAKKIMSPKGQTYFVFNFDAKYWNSIYDQLATKKGKIIKGKYAIKNKQVRLTICLRQILYGYFINIYPCNQHGKKLTQEPTDIINLYDLEPNDDPENQGNIFLNIFMEQYGWHVASVRYF